MNQVTAKENSDAYHCIQSVKGDLQPYRFNEDKSAKHVQLGFCNTMVDNKGGSLLHSAGQSLFERFNRTTRKQKSALPNANEMSVLKP